MFNLFGRKSEQEVIAEIHNEFDTAEDRLLDEADNLLKELNIPTETQIEQKANKLERLGFVNSEAVFKATQLKVQREEQTRKLVTTKQQAELIRYYKQEYPFLKFLTIPELERICEKYGLIFAPVKNYTKDVPDKNIKEIETVSALKKGDNPIDKSVLTVTRFWEDCPKEIRNILNGEVDCTGYFKTENESDIMNLVKRMGYTGSYTGWIYNSAKVVSTDNSGLFICAPQSHFNLKGLTKKGYGFLNVTTREIKDPIVFRYVRGGVQVISKWGLEASDESLVNEINN